MKASKILLIGWDAADWKVIRPLMDAGKMPHVRRMVENGATGPISTLHPPLSPMLWTSIATGKRPFKHGILGFSEPSDDGRGVRAVSNLSRKTKALWNILSQNHRRSMVIGWWPSHPAEPIDGVMVSDQYHLAHRPLAEGWPLAAHVIHPPELAETLAGLRAHPDQLTPAMVEPFIPLARHIDQDKDKRLGTCMRTLAECMSIQSAARWLIANQTWDFCAVYFDAIDHFCHGFMRYHPPRQSWVGRRDFELYHNVVSAAYELHDRMLGELVAAAGPDTVVILVSDHGFHPDHLRPSSIPDVPAGPAVEHRELGVLAMAGPGIRKGAALDGASVLDVTPTVLAICGLPVGEDMDGRVLSQALDGPELASIPSWDAVPGNAGCHPRSARLDPVAAHEMMEQTVEQMVALGYVEPPDVNHEVTVGKTVRELRYNLGEAYQDAGRHMEAREIFAALCAADPDEQRFAVRLFVSCQALGMLDEMRRIVDDLDGRRRALFEEAKIHLRAREIDIARWRNLARYQPAVTDYLKAQVLIAGRRYVDALAALERLTEAQFVRPGVLLQTGDLYARLGRAREARRVYERALEIDPDNAAAHIGLSRMALRRRQFGEAAGFALNAIQRNYRNPLAHYLLGRALQGVAEYPRATQAYRAAIWFNPHFPAAHLRLARLLERRVGDAESAREPLRLARAMRRHAAPLHAAACEKRCSPEMPPLEQSLVVVTGLPRSGTSMMMQMLAAGGMPILSDGVRTADQDNPRGYFEYAPVKNLLRDAGFLQEARGKAVKIIAPLMTALPPDLPCRVILCERDLDAVLDSQERMLARRNRTIAASPERRRMLRDEYSRMLERLKAALIERPRTSAIAIQYQDAIRDPAGTACKVISILGGGLDLAKMAAAVHAPERASSLYMTVVDSNTVESKLSA